MSGYSNGRAYEYKIRDHLISFGYSCIRAAGSKGKADLVALRPGEVLLVQVKMAGLQIAPHERRGLLELARITGGVPLVAHKPDRKPITYRRLTGLGPRDWEEWKPVDVVLDARVV